MTVIEFIKKWNIKEADVEIYVKSKDDIEWRDTKRYHNEEMVDHYPHKDRLVIVVEKEV